MEEMRRKDREMSREFAYEVIDKSRFGTLATIGEDESPYCVPISTAREGEKLYFHSAKQGTKIDNIKRSPNVCMSFVGDLRVPSPMTREDCEKAIREAGSIGSIASKKFTTEFESAVVKGRVTIVEDYEEKKKALRLISEKYTPENMPYFDKAIEASLDITCVLRLDFTSVKGKRKKFDKDGKEMKWEREE